MKNFLVLTRAHVLIVILTLLCIGVVTSLIVFQSAYRHRFFPNILLGGEPVGGKTFDEVAGRIRLVGEALKTTGVELIVPSAGASTTITIPERSIGLTPDVVVEYISVGDYEAALREAFSIGHTGSVWRRAREQLELLFGGRTVELPITVRIPAVESLLEREFENILKKPHDAEFVREQGEVRIRAESSGERIDIPAVISGLTPALTAMKTNRLQLAVVPEPPRVSREGLGAIADFARTVSRSLSVVFEYRGEEVYASGLTLATWLTVREEQGRTPVINREKVAEFLRRTVSAAIDDAPRNSRFAMKDGVLTETAPGVPGSGIRLDDVVQSLEQEIGRAYLSMLFPEPGTAPTITTKKIRIPVAFVQEPPRITAETIAEYNIKDLVGSAATSYRGSSASRRHNIKVGVERVSGLLIAPGEEFSLVKALGEVSEETGFEKEYVIKGDRSVKEAGGGLCQLATTVFRAALNAGLPITERQNHSYVVGYYGPGLDATIYGPWPDLRFVNDTGEYLLFQMKAQGDTLSAEFYGQKDGRQVTLSEPQLFDYIDPPPDKFIPAADKPWGVIECTDQARKGLSAEATYSVRYPSGEVQEKVFKSVYQPWPKICLVGIQIQNSP